jgi:hypothetical protein
MPSTHGSSRSGASLSPLSPTSSSASSLPGDEYRRLQKRQQHERLDAYFSQPHLAPSYTSIRPKTSYQAAHLPRERRVEISEVANATRRALGSNFDFTDGSYNCSQRTAAVSILHSARSRRNADREEKEEPMPQRYIDEFNKRWHEDDLTYERQHQYRADYTHSAEWRSHAGMYVDVKPLPSPRRERAVRNEQAHSYERRPLTRVVNQSRFSLETHEEPTPKRGFWNRFR